MLSFNTCLEADINLGEQIIYKSSICFTEIIRMANELYANIIIKVPYIDVNNRGYYIITGYESTHSYNELNEILEKNCNKKLFSEYKTWLLDN